VATFGRWLTHFYLKSRQATFLATLVHVATFSGYFLPGREGRQVMSFCEIGHGLAGKSRKVGIIFFVARKTDSRSLFFMAVLSFRNSEGVFSLFFRLIAIIVIRATIMCVSEIFYFTIIVEPAQKNQEQMSREGLFLRF
jgi:hypothetical protein